MKSKLSARFCFAAGVAVLCSGILFGVARTEPPKPVDAQQLAKRENLPRLAQTALLQYQREVDKLSADYARAMENQREDLLANLKKLSKQSKRNPKEQDAVDAIIAQVTGEPKVTNLLPEVLRDWQSTKPIRADLAEMQPGLLLLEYARHREQDTNVRDYYVEPSLFGDPIGDPQHISTLNRMTFDPDRNAIAFGYLKVDEPGEYGFRAISNSDRKMLLVDGQVVCGFGERSEFIRRITLDKGLIPICCVGFTQSMGWIELTWLPPGKLELETIPPDRLFAPNKLP